MRIAACVAVLLGCGCASSAPRVFEVPKGVRALTFEDDGSLLVAYGDVIERRDRAGSVTKSWNLSFDWEAFTILPQGGIAFGTNHGEAGETPARCTVTVVDASGAQTPLAAFPEACRILRTKGTSVLVGGFDGLFAEVDPSGVVTRASMPAGAVVRHILVEGDDVFAAGQSTTNGGFILQRGGWVQRFGSDYFDVAKDLELVGGRELWIVGSHLPDPAIDQLAGFFARIGRDGSGFTFRSEPAVGAVHQIAGSHAAGHSDASALTLGTCSHQSLGENDAYAGVLDEKGSFVNAWFIASAESDYGYALAAGPGGRIAVGGSHMKGLDGASRGWFAIFPRGVRGCGELAIPVAR